MGNVASRYRSMITTMKQRGKISEVVDMADYFDDEKSLDCIKGDGNKMNIWVDVHDKAEMLELPIDITVAQQRKIIAYYFGLSPSVCIHVFDFEGTLIDDYKLIESNSADKPYRIQYEISLPSDLAFTRDSWMSEESAESRSDSENSLKCSLVNGNIYSSSSNRHAMSNTHSSVPQSGNTVTLSNRVVLDRTATKELMSSPGFDVWSYSTEELITFLEFMLCDLGVVEELGIDNYTLKLWLISVEHNYRTIPFHNFRHAFSVTQMMYFIIYECDLSSLMTTLQLGVLLIACICHDLDHPGLNNVYQIKAKTDLSELYIKCSPLEHHHCAVAFQIFSVDKLNIFCNLEPEVMSAVTTVMIQLILATDMALHNEILENFLIHVRNGFEIDNPEHSLALQKILIKCCDISNEVRSLISSETWVDRLLEEFFLQGDKERREGISVEVYMDKKSVRKSVDQLKFIQGTLLPLFVGLSEVLPAVKKTILTSLKESANYYERMFVLEEERKEEKSANINRQHQAM